jgi:hypothetical protein
MQILQILFLEGRILAGVICDTGYLHPVSITFLATSAAAIQAFLLARYEELYILKIKSFLINVKNIGTSFSVCFPLECKYFKRMVASSFKVTKLPNFFQML